MNKYFQIENVFKLFFKGYSFLERIPLLKLHFFNSSLIYDSSYICLLSSYCFYKNKIFAFGIKF